MNNKYFNIYVNIIILKKVWTFQKKKNSKKNIFHSIIQNNRKYLRFQKMKYIFQKNIPKANFYKRNESKVSSIVLFCGLHAHGWNWYGSFREILPPASSLANLFTKFPIIRKIVKLKSFLLQIFYFMDYSPNKYFS